MIENVCVSVIIAVIMGSHCLTWVSPRPPSLSLSSPFLVFFLSTSICLSFLLSVSLSHSLSTSLQHNTQSCTESFFSDRCRNDRATLFCVVSKVDFFRINDDDGNGFLLLLLALIYCFCVQLAAYK